MQSIACAIGALALLTAVQANAQTLPTAGQYYPPGTTIPTSAQGVEQIGLDSITGARCMIGEASTGICQVPTGAGDSGSSTPAAGTASTIATGGTAVTMVTGPVNGCYIVNPASAADQGISVAENAYVNPVTTATTTGNGTNATLVPGQTFVCIPGQTTNVSVNAATSSHALTVVKW